VDGEELIGDSFFKTYASFLPMSGFISIIYTLIKKQEGTIDSLETHII
jgi:hypothetical protein